MAIRIFSTFWLPDEVMAEFSGMADVDIPQPAVTGVFPWSETLAKLPDYDGVLVSGERFDAAAVDRGLTGKLKVIGRHGVGCDSIDCDYAGAKGVAVVNTPVAVTEPTAELTIAIMLAVARGVVALDKDTRRDGRCGAFPSFDGAYVGLHGKTLGIIGFGRIGKAVAAKAAGLGMRVVYSDPIAAPREVEARCNAARVELSELFSQADVVSLHCPFVPENLHIINADTLALMKPSAILVNASRGKMVDEAALVKALADKRIKAAALDVYEFEPEVSRELLSMDNVVLVPHIGTLTYEARREMAREALTGMIAYLRGENPPNVFNSAVLVR